MAFNAAKFRANLINFAQPNHFELRFIGPLPDGTFNKAETNFFNTNFSFRAFSAQLPGRTLDTLERRYSGPSRMVPTGYVYQPMQISILENEDYDVRGFFDKWMNLVSGRDSWFCKYYDDLIVQRLVLSLYPRNSVNLGKDSAGEAVPSKVYTLHEVYPISVTSSQLDWGSNNVITVITVELQYHMWTPSDTIDEYVPPIKEGTKLKSNQVPNQYALTPGPFNDVYHAEEKDPYLKYTPPLK